MIIKGNVTIDGVVITQYSDGWGIKVGNKFYYWEHNEEDFGVNAIATLLRDLGFVVAVKEDF